MSDTILKKYAKPEILLQELCSMFGKNLQIDIDFKIINDYTPNASAKKIGDNKYIIKLNHCFFECDKLIETYTKRYSEDDYNFFHKIKLLDFLENDNSNGWREKLTTLFKCFIILNVIAHECSHIHAGHEDYVIPKTLFLENQERELVADWLGTKMVFKFLYEISEKDPFDSEDLLKALKQITIFFWLAQTLQYQIFDSAHTNRTIDNLVEYTHPHPAVRLYYCLDAMTEAIMDIFETRGLNDDQQELAKDILIKEIELYILSFLNITNTPLNYEKDNKEVISHYINLRDLPYSENGILKKDFEHVLHLCPLPPEYRAAYDAHMNEISK